jgi:hypothetical protein
MHNHLKAILAASLIAATVTGFAQSGTQPAQPASNPQTNHKDPADTSKGQDLVNPATPTDSTPATVGQDKSTGNNMVQPKAGGQMAIGVRPDFKAIDTKNHGYVLASEVNTPWLKQNFTKCDADGDGKVTKSEYETCAKQ